MVKAYRVFAYLIALEVVIQAAAISWAFFGFSRWIDDGNVFNKAKLDCDSCGWNFFAERGFMIHGINGELLIPLLSLILLVIAFFAKIPGGVNWAGLLFVLVIVQSQVLPALGHNFAIFGAVHGLNALLVFAVAIMAGKRVAGAVSAGPEPVAAAT